jgi:hypothetical protein
MKRILIMVPVLALVFVAGRLSNQPPVNAEGRGGQPDLGCLDLNGDGRISIADPIRWFMWYFHRAPEPECNVLGQLPATGQTQCSAFDGHVGDCDDPDYPGQDGFYQAGCPTAGRFVDNGGWHGDGYVHGAHVAARDSPGDEQLAAGSYLL